MTNESEKTFESKILDRHEEVRREVVSSDEFHSWKEDLPTVVVDDVTYYIRGGDMLKDEDQVVFEWARRTGLLTDDDLAREQH
jgi:hypothetical protein